MYFCFPFSLTCYMVFVHTIQVISLVFLTLFPSSYFFLYFYKHFESVSTFSRLNLICISYVISYQSKTYLFMMVFYYFSYTLHSTIEKSCFLLFERSRCPKCSTQEKGSKHQWRRICLIYTYCDVTYGLLIPLTNKIFKYCEGFY